MWKKRLLYVYSVPYDSGNAPCVFNMDGSVTDLLTLACCKGGKFNLGKPHRIGGLRSI